jgi:4-hydroxy-3-methylbut-2-enyl diphosphate reductase
LARQCDVVIVVGGENSNNTRELVNTCRHHCPHVHHIQTESDIRSEWVVGAGTVGVTAGTSTPEDVIDRVERQLRALVAGQSTASHTASSHP